LTPFTLKIFNHVSNLEKREGKKFPSKRLPIFATLQKRTSPESTAKQYCYSGSIFLPSITLTWVKMEKKAKLKTPLCKPSETESIDSGMALGGVSGDLKQQLLRAKEGEKEALDKLWKLKNEKDELEKNYILVLNQFGENLSNLTRRCAGLESQRVWLENQNRELRELQLKNETEISELKENLVEISTTLFNREEELQSFRRDNNGLEEKVKNLTETLEEKEKQLKVTHQSLKNVYASLLVMRSGGLCTAMSKELNTNLLDAAMNGQRETVKILIEAGANIDAKNWEGRTALHRASYRGHTSVAKLLIEKGANINEKNNRGDTSLHIASFKGRTQIVKMLIENGANIREKNRSGETPRDVASGRLKYLLSLLSDEKEINWWRRRSYAHFLSSLNQLPSDHPVTRREAMRIFNVHDMARQIGTWI
jgi:uncharacterized protein YoxC